MTTVAQLKAQIEASKKNSQKTSTSSAPVATAPVKPTTSVKPTAPVKPAPTKPVNSTPFKSSANRTVVERPIVSQQSTNKVPRESVQNLAKSKLVTAQLKQKLERLSPINESETPKIAMTVQTDNGTLATVSPAGVGYFQICFGGDTNSALTVSAELLREVWGIEYAAKQTKQVNSSARAAHELTSLLEARDQKDIINKVPKQLTHAHRRGEFSKTLREIARQDQVISTSDSDSEEESRRPVVNTSSVRAAVNKFGKIKQ